MKKSFFLLMISTILFGCSSQEEAMPSQPVKTHKSRAEAIKEYNAKPVSERSAFASEPSQQKK